MRQISGITSMKELVFKLKYSSIQGQGSSPNSEEVLHPIHWLPIEVFW